MSVAGETAVREIGPGRWAGQIHDRWDVAGNANGGYLMAIGARAMAADAQHPDPVTVTAHYVSPGRPGPVEIETSCLKGGKRFSTVRGTMTSEGRPLLALLGTYGDLTARKTLERIEGHPPEVADVDACIELAPTESFPPPFVGKIELRLDPRDALVSGRPAEGVPTVRGWFRLRDGEPIDTLALLIAVDAFPPTAFSMQLPVAWTPTLELTAHLRRRPAPGWLRCQFSTRFVSGGFLEEDGEVWDSTGALVAQSRQLALIPRG